MTTVMPKGVEASDFERALGEFVELLGHDAVLTSPEQVHEFRDPFWPEDDDTYTPSAVVMPESTEQVQGVVRIAGRYGITVWTHSQGRNNAYGGPAPRVGGSVNISLRNMNRVLEINEDLAYAVVEPGVRWYDLYDAIKAGGHELMISIPDTGWGSAIGNSLDNGVTYLPYGIDQQHACGMEVVLADGSLLRTGTGGIPNSKTWHLYKRGLGPVLDPLFMQSNFGIVTQMGIWLMRRPKTYAALDFVLWDLADVGQTIDTLLQLRLDNVLQGVPTFGHNLSIAAQMSGRSQWYDGDGPMPEEIQEKIGQEIGIGRWAMRAGLWGDEDMVEVRLAKIRRAFEAIPSAELRVTHYTGEQIGAEDIPIHHQVLAGMPNQAAYKMVEWYGGEYGGHVAFSPSLPLTGESYVELTTLMRGIVEGAGFDYMDGCMVIGERFLVSVISVYFDTRNAAQTKRAYEVVRQLALEAGKRGYGEYRAHLDFMDVAADQYSWNDHAYRRFCERIKDAVDPQGILSPGRHGIWPASMRQD